MSPRRSLLTGLVAALALLLPACAATFGNGDGSASPSVVATVVTEATTGPDATDSDPIVRVVKLVEPAVVNITVTSTTTNPFFGSSSQEGTGSGFVVSSSGVIFTNDHVIESASSISVTLPDGRSFDAEVLNTDAAHDLALLKIGATDLPTVTLGRSSSLQLGQSVVANRYALALSGGPTVTSGIISSLARTVQAQDSAAVGGIRTYWEVLQTSAAINPGNSGGSLVDLAGNVIGISTAGVSSADNIGFAIAIDAALPFIGSAVEGS